ncbi:MAG TPA: hypothetical protein VJT54_15365, partial [Verrucomicrobiae bacterium]|nr:hypothetical protein [Verrucomicrobiae bacterium]
NGVNNLSFLRGSILFAIILLVFGLVTCAQAQTTSSVLLNDAYATLAQAKHDYKGHRVRAMKQIEAALGELGGKISSTGRNHEPQGTSDAQLRAAQGLLEQARAGLSGKALKHVEAAINQISVALSIR